MRIDNGAMCCTTSNVVTGLPFQWIKPSSLDLDFHGTDLPGERIDHLRLPPLAHMEARQSIKRAKHILDHAPRLVADRAFFC